jgi:hypothetical protein
MKHCDDRALTESLIFQTKAIQKSMAGLKMLDQNAVKTLSLDHTPSLDPRDSAMIDRNSRTDLNIVDSDGHNHQNDHGISEFEQWMREESLGATG